MSLFDLQSLHNFFFLLKCYMSLFDLHSLCINYIHFKNSESISCCHPVLNIFFCILVDIGECKFIFVYVLCYVFSGLKDLTFLSIFPEQLHWWEGS